MPNWSPACSGRAFIRSSGAATSPRPTTSPKDCRRAFSARIRRPPRRLHHRPLSDDERRAKIDELDAGTRRVLVATDCLSEGINLQHAFNAALHYDLPWNPNRLEQREGRVDRFGQRSEVVKTIRYFSPDNAVDGVVLDVLLNKAREIHRTLGTHVPVPDESETVTEAVLNALFLRGRESR